MWELTANERHRWLPASGLDGGWAGRKHWGWETAPAAPWCINGMESTMWENIPCNAQSSHTRPGSLSPGDTVQLLVGDQPGSAVMERQSLS